MWLAPVVQARRLSTRDGSRENPEGFWREKSPGQETWFTNAGISQYPAEKSAINRPDKSFDNRSIYRQFFRDFHDMGADTDAGVRFSYL